MAKKKSTSSSASKTASAKAGTSRSRAGSAKKEPSAKTKKSSGGSKKISKKTTKKTTRKAPAAPASAKKPSKKTAKATGKTTKKASKSAAGSTTTKTVKKTTKKAAASKSTSKQPAKKPENKAVSKAQAPTKPAQKPTKPAEPAPPAAPPKPEIPASADGKPGDKRPVSNRPKRTKPPAAVMPEGIGGLLSPGGPAPKPLIASTDRVDAAETAESETYPTKSPFNKRELEKFRTTLLVKRAEVLSEVTGLEGDALTSGSSGNLSHTPQHMADAGSDAADQTISLDLAAAERNLIKEIDAALKRIREGVYGLCEATGRPIRKERLAELPWTRYSIDAARQLEGKRSS